MSRASATMSAAFLPQDALVDDLAVDQRVGGAQHGVDDHEHQEGDEQRPVLRANPAMRRMRPAGQPLRSDRAVATHGAQAFQRRSARPSAHRHRVARRATPAGPDARVGHRHHCVGGRRLVGGPSRSSPGPRHRQAVGRGDAGCRPGSAAPDRTSAPSPPPPPASRRHPPRDSSGAARSGVVVRSRVGDPWHAGVDAAAGHLGGACVRQAEDPPRVDLLAPDKALVLELLECRIDGTRAGAPAALRYARPTPRSPGSRASVARPAARGSRPVHRPALPSARGPRPPNPLPCGAPGLARDARRCVRVRAVVVMVAWAPPRPICGRRHRGDRSRSYSIALPPIYAHYRASSRYIAMQRHVKWCEGAFGPDGGRPCGPPRRAGRHLDATRAPTEAGGMTHVADTSELRSFRHRAEVFCLLDHESGPGTSWCSSRGRRSSLPCWCWRDARCGPTAPA